MTPHAKHTSNQTTNDCQFPLERLRLIIEINQIKFNTGNIAKKHPVIINSNISKLGGSISGSERGASVKASKNKYAHIPRTLAKSQNRELFKAALITGSCSINMLGALIRTLRPKKILSTRKVLFPSRRLSLINDPFDYILSSVAAAWHHGCKVVVRRLFCGLFGVKTTFSIFPCNS